MRAHARIRIRCERVQCEHMRAYANAHIRIASHANAFLMRHASIRIRYLGVFRVRYARICAHSHAMRAHSHRMRSHSHRMRSHRMRMRAFKGNLCVSGTVHIWFWNLKQCAYLYDCLSVLISEPQPHGCYFGWGPTEKTVGVSQYQPVSTSTDPPIHNASRVHILKREWVYMCGLQDNS